MASLQAELIKLQAEREPGRPRHSTVDVAKQSDLLTSYVSLGVLQRQHKLLIFQQAQRLHLTKGLHVVGLVMPSSPSELLTEDISAFASSPAIWKVFNSLTTDEPAFITALQVAAL